MVLWIFIGLMLILIPNAMMATFGPVLGETASFIVVIMSWMTKLGIIASCLMIVWSGFRVMVNGGSMTYHLRDEDRTFAPAERIELELTVEERKRMVEKKDRLKLVEFQKKLDRLYPGLPEENERVSISALTTDTGRERSV